MGLSILCNFTSTRVLSGVTINHVESEAMTYLGKYGVNEAETVKNYASGETISPVSIYNGPLVAYGDNFFRPSTDTSSAGVNAANQVMQLPCTLFISFNAGDIPAAGEQFRDIASMWGDSGTVANTGRFSIGLYRNAAGVRYISCAWGIVGDYLSCSLEFDWTKATDKVKVIASRDENGNIHMELRSGGVTLNTSGTLNYTEIQPESSNWRAFFGQISSRPTSGLRVYAGAAWSKTLTPEQLTAEMEVMKINLAGYV